MPTSVSAGDFRTAVIWAAAAAAVPGRDAGGLDSVMVRTGPADHYGPDWERQPATGVTVAATDRYLAHWGTAPYTQTEGERIDATVSAKELLAAVKSWHRATVEVTLDIQGTDLLLTPSAGGDPAALPLTDSAVPTLWRMFGFDREPAGDTDIAVNGLLLHRTAVAAKTAGGKNAHVKLRLMGRARPAQVRVSAPGADWTASAMVMPIRWDSL